MVLDFSVLGLPTPSEIPKTSDKVELSTQTAKAPENSPQEATGDALGTDPAADPAEEVRQIRERHQEPTPARMKLGRLQAEYQRYREAYKEYQDNIKKSEVLRAQITKEAKAGADPTTLLLLAIECIAAMTDDKMYYTYLSEILTTA